MKATFSTLAIAFVVWLLIKQPTTLSQVSSNPISDSQLSRDLTPVPNFFQEGLKKTEVEIHRLIHTGDISAQHPLNNKVNPQVELDRLPQIQPSDFPTPHQSSPE